MNILIIGGLLGLAVLAILGAVLLGMGEDRSEKAAALLPQQSQSRQASSPAPAQPAVPATPQLSRPTVPLSVPGTSETTGRLSLADLNGQVREITGELRVLAQRAGELQQRLITLGDTLERKEHSHIPDSTDLLTEDEETQVF